MPGVLTRSFIGWLAVAGATVLVCLLAITSHGSPGGASIADAAACAPTLPHASGVTSETIVSSSITRDYILQVPPGYDGTTETPLVFLLHGNGGFASTMPAYTKLNAKADAEGFILVAPQGVTNVGGPNSWNAFNAPTYPNDVIFVNDMLNELESELCIDPLRVFSTGISMGAMMSVRLSCSLSSRIAAIGPVAGVYFPPWSTDLALFETCPDTRPVPMISLHGTADTLIPFHGGSGAATGLRDIEAAIMPDWANHNSCSPTPGSSTAAPGVRLVEYPGCAGAARTMLYIVEDADGTGPSTEGGGHQWPNAAIDLPQYGVNTHLIDATDLIWDFFEAHPLITDFDVDGVSDSTDNCPSWANPSQALPPWSVPAGDADCDGFTTAIESDPDIGTSPNDACADTTTANDEANDKWPADFNDNGFINTLDLTVYATALGKLTGHPQYAPRADLNQNGVINTLDLTVYATMLGKMCSS